MPPIQVTSVCVNEPPASKQYQDAIAALYGIGFRRRLVALFAASWWTWGRTEAELFAGYMAQS